MKWERWQSSELDRNAVSALAKSAGCSLLLAAVLWARGLRDKDALLAHLAVDATALHDPFLLAGMQAAVERLQTAIAQKEQIAIYGDYDVDGITSTVLLHDYLTARGRSPLIYIPDRLGEGYGLNPDALLTLKNAGATLILTVDCGVSAVEEVAYANDLGLDVIITDHHKCGDTLPDAVAVVCPHRADCHYPNKSLAGVGVAFKLLCAMETPDMTSTLLTQYGDLVATGTVADVMALSGENRSLVFHGLNALRDGSRAGFAALMQANKSDSKRFSATDISFGIAPKINAAGRMGDAMLAFSLLSAADLSNAQSFCQSLFDLNEKRRKTESDILAEALTMLDAENYSDGPIVLAAANWHKGVLGVVAARLAERFHVPVIVLTIEGNTLSGSCRSVPGFDLFSALRSTADFLDAFGGHTEAAGISLDLTDFDAFRDAFCAYYKAHPPTTAASTFTADFTVRSPELLRIDQIKSLTRLEPSGTGNEPPALILAGARLLKIQGIGDNKHVKLQIEQWGEMFDAVFFHTTPESLPVEEGSLIDLLFAPQINHFRGRDSVQLLVKDIRCATTRQVASIRAFYDEEISISAHEAQTLLPNRNLFAHVWRTLLRESKEHQGSFREVLHCLAKASGEISLSQTYLCLRVFEELELLTLTETEETIQILVLESPIEKRALETSKLYHHLQERGKTHG